MDSLDGKVSSADCRFCVTDFSNKAVDSFQADCTRRKSIVKNALLVRAARNIDKN